VAKTDSNLIGFFQVGGCGWFMNTPISSCESLTLLYRELT
jgi:hypothetical protein